MPLGALLLVVTAACLHATWNLVAKRAGGGVAFVWLYGCVTVACYAPVAAWVAWTERPAWGLAEWTAVTASACIHVGYSVLLQRGYVAADLSVVYPVARGVGPLLTALGAVLLLGERPSPLGTVGIGTIVVGVVVVARGWALFGKGAAKGLGWGLTIGLFIAAYTLVDGYAVKRLLVAPLLLDWVVNALRLAILTGPALRDRAAIAHEWRTHRAHALAIGILAPLGYILVLTAMQMAPVSYVAPARELSLLVGALLGTVVLGEEDSRARLAGAALIAAGVVAIGLG